MTILGSTEEQTLALITGTHNTDKSALQHMGFRAYAVKAIDPTSGSKPN